MLVVIFGWVYDVISHLICILNTSFKIKHLRIQYRYLQTVNGILVFGGILKYSIVVATDSDIPKKIFVLLFGKIYKAYTQSL